MSSLINTNFYHPHTLFSTGKHIPPPKIHFFLVLPPAKKQFSLPIFLTMLRQLTISGVRSYSDTNEQTIEFMSPLTIILGSNGSGKTTIVESIQYCLTGAFPPLSDNGKRFVREPEIEHSSAVKARIQLVATGTNNQTLTITRRFQVSLKEGKKAFQTFDTAVELGPMDQSDGDDSDGGENTKNTKNTKNSKNTKNNAVSNRNRDLVDHIPKLLGIPPAIMQHVLFLHHEDSHWPLSEDKKVKDRFDVIFSSDKYSDALNQYRDHRRELVSKQTEERHRLTSLTERYKEYHILRANLRQYQDESFKNQESITNHKEIIQKFESN